VITNSDLDLIPLDALAVLAALPVEEPAAAPATPAPATPAAAAPSPDDDGRDEARHREM
jgi:hypothetical protein